MGPGWPKTRKKREGVGLTGSDGQVAKHRGSGKGPEAPGMAVAEGEEGYI